MSSPVQCPMTKNLLPEKRLSLGNLATHQYIRNIQYAMANELTGQVSGMFKAFADLATDQYIRQSVLNNRPLVEGLTDEALAGGPSDDGALAPDD